MSESIDTVTLKENTDIVAVIGKYVELKRDGIHYVGCCPFHEEKTPSFKVTPRKNIFKCWGCGKGGDVIAFLMYQNKTFEEAIKELSDPNNTAALVPGYKKEASKKVAKEATWRQIIPAPEAASIFHYKHGVPSQTWKYHDANGALAGYICRFDLPEGRKEVLPYIYATDGTRKEWKWMGFEKPRSLYDLHILEKYPTQSVLMVEGEKTAEAAKKLFPNTNVTTWIGGAKAIKQTNFSVLRGRIVIFWSDNDQPGIDAMLEINDIIKGYCQTKWVLNPETVPKGWDLADSEWTPEEARAYSSKHIISVPERDHKCATYREYSKIESVETQGEKSDEEIVSEILEDRKTKSRGPKKTQPPQPPANDDEGAPYPLRGSNFFRILGAMKEGNGMLYSFYSFNSKTVISLSPSSMTKNNLLQLAPLDWWKNTFPDKNGFCVDEAVDYLIHKSAEKGTFNERWIRGRGAWIDEKRVVIHAGDKLFIDGKITSLQDYTSKYIYEIGEDLGFSLVKPISNESGVRFVNMLGLLNWERPVNALLLAGWCVVAPVCGALDWRPHIWITGAAGTGKTFIFKEVIRALLGETALAVQGETSEAGLRQLLKHDALPVVFDEAEGEDRRSQERMQSVISLMRSSSSNDSGVLAKGSTGGHAKTYLTRSCFAFASIGFQATQQSDRSRLSPLGLIKATDEAADSRYQELLKTYYELVTSEFCAGIRSRTVGLLPFILYNVKIFSKAAATVLGEQRAGDQIGVLLAGAYSLLYDDKVTLDQATTFVSGIDWNEEKSNDALRDEIRLISHLLQQVVRIETDHATIERTTGELVQCVMGLRIEYQFAPEKANDRLKRAGMKVVDDWLYISNSDDQIKKFLYNTPWTNNHNKILMRLPEAESVESSRFASGITTRAVKLKKDVLFKDMQTEHVHKELSLSEQLAGSSVQTKIPDPWDM